MLLSSRDVDGDKPPMLFVIDDVVQTGYQAMLVEPGAVGRVRDFGVQVLPQHAAAQINHGGLAVHIITVGHVHQVGDGDVLARR